MPLLDHIEIQGKTGKIAVDDEGYLVNIDEWDEHVAQALAEREGIPELTEEKLDILKFIHEYYKKYDFFPILGAVCKWVKKPKDCMIEEFTVPLLAWKLAGLPHPEEPIISLLEAGQSPG
jgi:TusE/DsrC/DsvC family sulfur relay protein